MQKQFVLPEISLVPHTFVSLANILAIADTGNPVLTRRDYEEIADKMRLNVFPSLRLSKNGIAKTESRQGGQVFFNPIFATPSLVGEKIAKVVEKLADYKFKPATAKSKEGRLQRKILARDFRYDAPVAAPKQAVLELLPSEEAVEVKPQSALTDQTNLAERMVAGIEEVKGTNSEMLAAIRENTAVMTKLLAVWAPA